MQKTAACVIILATIVAGMEIPPNPREQPGRCGYGERPTGMRHHVCSPDGHLTRMDMTALDSILSSRIVYFETGMAVIDSIPDNFYTGTTREAKAEKLGRMIYDSWGIGDPEEQRGVLILLVVGDRTVRIITGKGVAKYIPDERVAQIIEKMKPYLREKNYGDALAMAVLELGDSYVFYFGEAHLEGVSGSMLMAAWATFFVAMICVAWWGTGNTTSHQSPQGPSSEARGVNVVYQGRAPSAPPSSPAPPVVVHTTAHHHHHHADAPPATVTVVQRRGRGRPRSASPSPTIRLTSPSPVPRTTTRTPPPKINAAKSRTSDTSYGGGTSDGGGGAGGTW